MIERFRCERIFREARKTAPEAGALPEQFEIINSSINVQRKAVSRPPQSTTQSDFRLSWRAYVVPQSGRVTRICGGKTGFQAGVWKIVVCCLDFPTTTEQFRINI